MIIKQQYNNLISYRDKLCVASAAEIPAAHFVLSVQECAKALLPLALWQQTVTDPIFCATANKAVEMIDRYLRGEVEDREYYPIANILSNKNGYSAQPASSIRHAVYSAKNHVLFEVAKETSSVFASAHGISSTESYKHTSVNIEKIFNKYFSWDHILSSIIVVAIINDEEESNNHPNHLTTMYRLLGLPKLDRQNLFQYADTILACDNNLKEEFVFLIKDYINKCGLQKKLYDNKTTI
jgi:hypothetical protein